MTPNRGGHYSLLFRSPVPATLVLVYEFYMFSHKKEMLLRFKRLLLFHFRRGEVLFAVGGWCSGNAIESVEVFDPQVKMELLGQYHSIISYNIISSTRN